LKTDADLQARVPALFAALAEQWSPDLVVVACNTASTIALDQTRAALGVPVVGVVPPIKPAAAQTKTGTIGLLATPATVRRPYTDDLIAKFAVDKTVIRFGSSALVEAAEQKLRGEPFDSAAITEAIQGLFGVSGGADTDVVALACTHFPLLAQELSAAAPRDCVWLDSGAAIARRVVDVIGAQPGASTARHLGFTDIQQAHGLAPAMRARGFAGVMAIGPAPDFRASGYGM
jgi:glutamate racemase